MNSKGANVIFTSIMIILLSVTAMIIIIGFVLPFFTSLREEMKFNQNKENLLLINKEFAELKTNDIGTFKNLNLDVVDEIVFDATTNTVYIKQKISSNSFKNFKDSNIGNLSIIKANGLMTFTLYLEGVVTLEKTVVVNGNYPLRLTIIDIVNNIHVVSITPYLGQVYLTINPKISTFIGKLNITINATPEDANIYYTLDGSEPTESSIQYNGPFTITDSATIKARGYANGYAESAITSKKYIKLIQIIYRKKITIDHKKVDDNLTDFPVLISIRDENLVSLAKEDGSDIYFTSSDGTTRLKREIESFTDINLFRKKITINHTKVESTLTNFPILIKLTDVNLASFAQSDGSDIYFTLSDGTTRLKREIEDYNSETGTLVAWVKIPSLSSTADTNFYIYFGDKTESNSNDTDVWNSDYNAVYHMNDKTNSTMLDSTAFGNDITKKGANEPNQIIGKIGYAQDFDGTDDYAVMKNAVEVVSVSFWVNEIEGISGADYIIGGEGNEDGGFRYLDNDSSWLMYYGTGYKSLVWNHGGNETGWHLINIERSITDIRDFNVYVDGENIGITTANTTTPAKIYFNQIGRRYMLYNLDGVLDEIQYRNKNKSAEWIKTEYNNQSSPEDFYSVGEIEKITTKELIAWVRVPDLSSITDTEIHMYFGNENENNSNDKDVWNSDYNAVYHMNDKTNSTMLDSTAFENDVTKKGANEPNQIIGKIGYAQDFDGTDDYAVMKNAVEVVSVSFWVNEIEGISGADYIIGGEGNEDGGFRYLDNDSSWLMYYGTGYKSLVWNHGGNETGWHLINIERSITDIRDFNVYVDGENIGITTANTTTPAKIYFNQIGRRYMLYNLDGVLDEIQYRNKNKSAEWIKTEYNNQSSPETFYNIGNLEELQE